MNEKLSADDGIKAYIDDFKKSDAPQFQGKSASKRKEMAIAAYLDAKRGTKKEDAPCWDGYKQIGMKKKGDRMVPNCMPENYREDWKKDSGWKKVSGPRKDEYGNTIKKQNVAKHLAKKAMNKTKAGMKEESTWADKTFLDELTAREKEMIAKRKAARGKKKMTPSKKAGKDATRDGAGRQGQKNKSFVPRTAGVGTGKSKGTEHIIMQLRKAQDVGGNMDIQVSPKGKKVRLAKKDIDALLRRHDSMQKPRDKRLFRVMLTRKLRQK